VKVCLIPMEVLPGKRAANLARALDWMEQVGALEPAPDLLVFPECVDLGITDRPPAPDLVEPAGGPFAESLAERARDLGIYVAAGLTEQRDESLLSSAILLDPDGDTILRHRRIMLPEDSYFARGESIRVRRTPLGCIGLLAGADVWEAHLIGAFALMGADLVVAPNDYLPEQRSPASVKSRIARAKWPTGEGVPSVVSVAASAPSGAADAPSQPACSFFRDPAGNITVFNESGREETIYLEV